MLNDARGSYSSTRLNIESNVKGDAPSPEKSQNSQQIIKQLKTENQRDF